MARRGKREILNAAIDAFLETRRKSDGGWAKIEPQDINDLSSIISRLIGLKCEKDPDGDYPINYDLINRLTHGPVHYEPVLYSSFQIDDELPEWARDWDHYNLEKMRAVIGNIRTAAREMTVALEGAELERQRRKEES